MKNGEDKLFVVKKPLAVLGNQFALLEGDVLKWIDTDTDEIGVNVYFEVVNSFFAEGLEIVLIPAQVANHLGYKTIQIR